MERDSTPMTPYQQVHTATSVFGFTLLVHKAVADGKLTKDLLEPLLRVTNGDPRDGAFFDVRGDHSPEDIEFLSFALTCASVNVTVDMTQLDGQAFEPTQVGGWVGLLKLLEHARTVVARLDPDGVAALGHVMP